jgi:murein endopeptidase
MKLAEWRKEQGISHYSLGSMLGIKSINPATNSQRYCLESKEKRFPKPKMVKKILEVTKGKVTLEDLYNAWWEYEESKK